MIVSIIITLLLSTNVNNPVELGKVNWLRSYDKALKESQEKDKPIFILFQEVPGCSTCQKYGSQVLSHPLIVEAIEDEFIPLVIYNNKGGEDRKILDKYQEPTWNNPVVRIVNNQGNNLIPRLSGNYSAEGVVGSMIYALHKANKITPNYLENLRQELEISSGTLNESYLSMYCFWTGEKVIGSMDGVASTEAGFMDGREVVKISYNPNMISFEDMVKNAKDKNCADGVYTNDKLEREKASDITRDGVRKVKSYRIDKQPQYYLSNSTYQYVPMTTYQAMKINAALGKGHLAEGLLSPRQQELHEMVKDNRNKNWKPVYNKDFSAAWWSLSEVQGVKN